jgi:hypothetical protein
MGFLLHQDIDAMPIHPLENMPEVMRRCRVLMDSGDCSLLEDAKDHKLRVAVTAGGAARAALNERLEWPSRHMIPFTHLFLNDLSKRAQVCPCQQLPLFLVWERAQYCHCLLRFSSN